MREEAQHFIESLLEKSQNKKLSWFTEPDISRSEVSIAIGNNILSMKKGREVSFGRPQDFIEVSLSSKKGLVFRERFFDPNLYYEKSKQLYGIAYNQASGIDEALDEAKKALLAL